MVGPKTTFLGNFMPNNTDEQCLTMPDVIKRIENDRLLEYGRPWSESISLEIGKAILAFANEQNIIAAGYPTSFITGLVNTRLRVQMGQQIVKDSGCGNSYYGVAEAADVVDCPTDPSSRCAGCYRQLIDSLVEYDGNALESDTPQVRKYKKVIKKAGHQSKKRNPEAFYIFQRKTGKKLKMQVVHFFLTS